MFILIIIDDSDDIFFNDTELSRVFNGCNGYKCLYDNSQLFQNDVFAIFTFNKTYLSYYDCSFFIS